MATLATLLSVASGFVLMRYQGAPVVIIATSLIIDAALAPLTATIAARRGRSPLIWLPLGFVFGAWALAAALLMSSRDRDSPPAPSPPTSDAA